MLQLQGNIVAVHNKAMVPFSITNAAATTIMPPSQNPDSITAAEADDNGPSCSDSILLMQSCRLNVVSTKPCGHKYHEDCILGWFGISSIQ
jgi:hypothetical protein